jgi:hypothetical protein
VYSRPIHNSPRGHIILWGNYGRLNLLSSFFRGGQNGDKITKIVDFPEISKLYKGYSTTQDFLLRPKMNVLLIGLL